MVNYLEKYGYYPKTSEIDGAIANISANVDGFMTEDVLKACFSMLDLTSLKTNDTEASIAALVEKVNAFPADYPGWPYPASAHSQPADT